MSATQSNMSKGEFVTLMAVLISIVAFSIDAMLPALTQIGADLGVHDPNDNQLVISSLFLGFAVAQIVFGPLSDSFGRKPMIYLGIAIFIGGCLLSIYGTSFSAMLTGRVLQGIGVAAPRIICVAIVRDGYEGRGMAQIMSFIMAVFVLVPALAPAVGQGILLIADWRAIFWVFLAQGVIAAIWLWMRLPETLSAENRRPFALKRIFGAILETCKTRVAFGYTIAAGLIFGAFVGYLITSQQILAEQYALGDLFPLYFGALALAIGGASVTNARLVQQRGMRPLCYLALYGLNGLSVVFWIYTLVMAGNPPLWIFMAYMMPAFFCLGILFGNFNALAMEPLGHIAGVAAAVIGAITTLISLSLGTAIGQAYDGTILPLISGFTFLGLAALGVMWLTERGRTD